MTPHAGNGLSERRQARERNRPGAGPPRAGGGRRRAFSLAELMIALAVLGMGLLIISAALPAGVKYTKETVDTATAQAAAEYAFQIIEQRLCLRDSIVDPLGSIPNTNIVAHPCVFEPRFPPNDPHAGQTRRDYEPVFKVRPLFTQQISADPAGNYGSHEAYFNETYLGQSVWPEELIERWFVNNTIGHQVPATSEYDRFDHWGSGPALRPAICAAELVYPPITADALHVPDNYLQNWASMYQAGPMLEPGAGHETLKALDRHFTWTALYRRVSYAAGSDPSLYEFIVVVTRRPSPTHRYARQDSANAGMNTGAARGPAGYRPGGDNGAPSAWLVQFRSWSTDYFLAGTHYTNDTNRILLTAPPPTISFRAGPEVGQLLPPGSIIIPALNDLQPDDSLYNGPHSGFIPNAPDALPIYEVIERVYDDPTLGGSGEYDIVVKNNGFYPWVNPIGDRRYWPAWIIPPAIEEVVGSGASATPVFSDKSPILAVARRVIHLQRVP